VTNSHVNLAWINAKQGNESNCRELLQRSLETGFLWREKAFLESENDFGAVQDTAWFQELLTNITED